MKHGKTRFHSSKNTCSVCDSSAWTEISYSDTVETKGLHVNVEGLHANYCEPCRHTWITPDQRRHNDEQIRAAYIATRDKIRDTEGLLSTSDIQYIRQRFDLSQRDASHIFGGGINAFNKYESGEVLQSQAMDRLLRLTNEFGVHAVEFLRTCKGAPIFRPQVTCSLDDVVTGSINAFGTGGIGTNRMSLGHRIGSHDERSADFLFSSMPKEQFQEINTLPEKIDGA
ncbi:type II TA system antitoxin MqsA family protein [Burkholderia cepacia]|uniref:type II TA system antitoxin MqsA family protein n=1 Tax=Burkholderia cepacia TaxID=292 RepID=UPI002FE04D74